MVLTNELSTTIEKTEVIDFYRTLLENQSSNYSTLINFFLAISGILITVSLAYNYIIAKSQIKNEVEKEVKNIEDNLKVKYDIYLQEEIIKIEESIKNKLLNNESSTYMAISMQCLNNKDFSSTIKFYFLALQGYIDLEFEIVIRQVIESIYNMLTNDYFASSINIEQVDYDDYIKVLNKIPTILTIEKENILKELNTLKNRNNI